MADADDERGFDLRTAYGKAAIFIIVVLVCLVVVHATPLGKHVEDVQILKADLEAAGILAPAAFVGGAALLILVGVPRLLFCLLGGIFFGFLEGLLLSQVATVAGAYGSFLFARWGSREWLERLAERSRHARIIASNPTVLAVFLMRQIPLDGAVLSVLLGLTRVRHGTFLAGSILGFLPEATVVTLLGSGTGDPSALSAFLQVLTAVAVLALGAGIIWKLIEKNKARIRAKENGACIQIK